MWQGKLRASELDEMSRLIGKDLIDNLEVSPRFHSLLLTLLFLPLRTLGTAKRVLEPVRDHERTRRPLPAPQATTTKQQQRCDDAPVERFIDLQSNKKHELPEPRVVVFIGRLARQSRQE